MRLTLNSDHVKSWIRPRKKDSNKTDYGRVLIFAGSYRYTGAAYLCTQAAVRTGSGLVTLATDKDILGVLAVKLNEAMLIDNNSHELVKLVQNADAIAIGPGMGNEQNTFKALNFILDQSQAPIVIDADGLNVLQTRMPVLMGRKNLILTPHEGEFARLLGVSSKEVKEHREKLAVEFALHYKVNLLLKGCDTIITDGKLTIINPTGTPKMASGGMGDALTGMIASLLGQGLNTIQAASAGAYIHGLVAQRLGQRMFSVTATDLIENIPNTLFDMLSE